MSALTNFSGMPVYLSDLAMITHYNFPLSKNRSKRVHKKLLKRFGLQIVQRPTIFKLDGNLYVHPSLKDRLFQGIPAKEIVQNDRCM